jgi:hypothetical protein
MKLTRRTLLTGTAALLARPAAAATELAVRDGRFLLNGKPTFLLGISYYAGLGAADASVAADLKEMQSRGFNWLRVWATWDAFENDVAAVDGEGRPREPYLSRLKALVKQLDSMGMVADVTLSRGEGSTGVRRLLTHEAHRRAVETVVDALKPWRNWYLDLANERNIGDRRFARVEELKVLRERVRQLDPGRLVTASPGGDIGADELREYVREVQVDFITPHRPRGPESPGQTEAKTREYRAQMEALGRVVPVHYQEPFRRGYASWNPTAEDFAADLAGARAGGAAGWCFHNGDRRDTPDHRPRRSFDLRDQRLFAQFDQEERKAVERLGGEPAR